MVNSVNFNEISKQIPVSPSKRVEYMDVVLEMTDTTGKIYLTDIMLQGGGVATSWVGHVSEIRWSFDNA